MSTQKALEIIVEMTAVYGVTLEPPALRAWKRVLAGADPRDVEAAATEWMRSEKWMPKPSEFLERVQSVRLLRMRWQQQRERELRILYWQAEQSRDPHQMRKVAAIMKENGRMCAAAALLRKAEFWTQFAAEQGEQ